MVDKPEATGPEPQGAPSPRRRFLTHGLTAAGGAALLLSSTRHAVAKVTKGGSCGMLTMSGHQSAINAAKKGHTTSATGKKFCPGKTYTTWGQGTGWPTGCHPKNGRGVNATLFTDCYGTGYAPIHWNFASNETLLNCLTKGNSNNAATQFGAAYLNAAGGASNYPYTTAQLQSIWRSHYTNISALTSYATYFSQYLNVG